MKKESDSENIYIY